MGDVLKHGKNFYASDPIFSYLSFILHESLKSFELVSNSSILFLFFRPLSDKIFVHCFSKSSALLGIFGTGSIFA